MRAAQRTVIRWSASYDSVRASLRQTSMAAVSICPLAKSCGRLPWAVGTMLRLSADSVSLSDSLSPRHQDSTGFPSTREHLVEQRHRADGVR